VDSRSECGNYFLQTTFCERLITSDDEQQWSTSNSGAGTNLKVGGGAHAGHKTPEKIMLSCPSLFWLYKYN